MTSRFFNFSYLLSLFALSLTTSIASSSPNFLFLMADDLGFGDVGFNGNPIVQTPHLDSLAQDGMRFTRFYSVGPVCSPTRACVQTGRHCMRFGMINVNVGKLPAGEINMAQIAKSKGYATGHFGKWHLGTMTKDPELSGPNPDTTAQRYGPPWERHYDTTFTTETNIATWDPLDESGLRIPKHRAHFWSNGVEIKGDYKGSSEKIIVDKAIDFIKDAASEKKPFFSTIWFYGPHNPTRAGPELRALYSEEPLGKQHYLGSITSIDQEVGRIRHTLRELGVEGDTLIFFCSDNGPEGDGNPGPQYDPYDGVRYGSAGEYKGRKRYLYNGGVCVPAFAFWPNGIKAGQTVETPICSLDYLPTLVDLLNFKMPDDRPIDGESILSLLKSEPWSRERFIPFASQLSRSSPKASIIHKEHKLLLWFDPQKEDELYNVRSDPREERNLAREKPELTQALKRELMQWLQSARHSFEKGDYSGYAKQGSFINTSP